MVKNPPANARGQVRSLGQEDPLGKGMALSSEADKFSTFLTKRVTLKVRAKSRKFIFRNTDTITILS